MKRKLSDSSRREKQEFRDNEAIAGHGIPDIAVAKAVDIDLAVAISVAVGVRHEEYVREIIRAITR